VPPIKVLFVTSEVAGLAKAGGLGDVSAGLPLALRRRGIDVRVLMPAYSEVIAKLPPMHWHGDLPGRAGIPPARIGEARLPTGMVLYLAAAPALFDRRGTPYYTPEGADWQDNHLRFARLSLAAADIAAGRGGLDWTPDLVHANDWPGGLAPAYMRWDGTEIPTVLTIHNIAYQGNFDASQRHALGIPDAAFDINEVEFHGRVSFLKAGGFYASHVTTVSPTYAREITTETQGAGLHGLMGTRAGGGPAIGHRQWHRRKLGSRQRSPSAASFRPRRPERQAGQCRGGTDRAVPAPVRWSPVRCRLSPGAPEGIGSGGGGCQRHRRQWRPDCHSGVG